MSERSGRPPLFDRLVTGLDECIQHARGELDLRVTPAPPPRPRPFRAAEIADLRSRLQMSRVDFARTINVSAKTVQGWEQGDRAPSGAALRFLQVLAAEPEVIRAIVGVDTVAPIGPDAVQ